MYSEKELYELLEAIHKDEIMLDDPSISMEAIEGLREFINGILIKIEVIERNKSFFYDYNRLILDRVTPYLGLIMMSMIFCGGSLQSKVIRRSDSRSCAAYDYVLFNDYHGWAVDAENVLRRILVQLKQAKVRLKLRQSHEQVDINNLCASSIFAKTKELFYKEGYSVPDKQLRDAVYDSMRDSLEGKMFDGFYASTLTQLEDHKRLFEDYNALRKVSTEPQQNIAKEFADMERKVDALTISCNKNQKRITEQDQEIKELKVMIEGLKNSQTARTYNIK